jgi:hypothetical protein
MTPAEVENQKGFVGAFGILNTFLNKKYSRITNPPYLSSDMRFANMADSGGQRFMELTFSMKMTPAKDSEKVHPK